MKKPSIILIAASLFARTAWPAILVYDPMPIDYRLSVNLIQVSTSNGELTATAFGNAAQTTYIEEQINRIWAQAGIEVQFSTSLTPYWDDFAFDGRPGNYLATARPESHLWTILNNGNRDGVGSDNPLVVDAYFMKITPGWAQRGAYYTNGYAVIGGAGLTFYTGSSMLLSNANMDIIAGVFAHELAHNLGLTHVNNTSNLLNPTIYQGLLENWQIDWVRSNPYGLLLAIPEPNTWVLLATGLLIFVTAQLRFRLGHDVKNVVKSGCKI